MSSERYRALELLLRRRGRPAAGTRLLEVAPIHTVAGSARSLGYDYTSIDLSSPRAQVHADLCLLPFTDATFDVVVCFHVLEHITDDRAAVRELARIVRPGGTAVVVVPRDQARSVTFEDAAADPADYERLYGQSDHVRIYGREVSDRWRQAGATVREDRWTDLFPADDHRRAALHGDDDRFWVIEPIPGPASSS